MKQFWIWVLAVVIAGGGCSGESFDASMDVEVSRARASKMSKGALEKTALLIAKDIEETSIRYREVEARIKAIPLEDQFGKKAVRLKEEAGKLAGRISSLNMHYDPYMHYYIEKGGSYDKIKLRR